MTKSGGEPISSPPSESQQPREPRRIRPETIFVRGFGFSEGLEWGLWLALTVFWIVELDLSPTRLVLLGVVLEGTVLLSETPTGVIADVRSRRASLILAQALMAVSFIWAFASTNYWVILPAQAMVGFGWTFRSGADTAWITDELKGRTGVDEVSDDEIEGLLLRRHRWGMIISLVVGPATIAIGWWQSVRVVGIALGLAYLLVAGWMALVMTEDHFVPGTDRGAGFRDTLREGFAVVRKRPRLRILVLVIALVYLGSEVFDRLGYVHFLDNVGISDLDASGQSLLAIGILFFIAALAGITVNIAAQRSLTSGAGVVRVAVGLLVIACIGGLIASATNLVALIGLGYLLQDGVREALWPVMEGWANRDAPSEVRATVHSLMGQTTSVGEITGGLLFGAVAEATSIPLAMAGGAVFFGLGGLVATKGITKRTPPRTT